jgi:hypothetical protein
MRLNAYTSASAGPGAHYMRQACLGFLPLKQFFGGATMLRQTSPFVTTDPDIVGGLPCFTGTRATIDTEVTSRMQA